MYNKATVSENLIKVMIGNGCVGDHWSLPTQLQPIEELIRMTQEKDK